MRVYKTVFAAIVTALVCWAFVQQAGGAPVVQKATPPMRRLSYDWQDRVRATADTPKLARQVILDSIYANQTLPVALAYEEMYNQKPDSQERIANFAHAMVIAEVFDQERGKLLTKPYGRAIRALKKIAVPEQDLYPTERAKAAIKKTKVADAWLAWGIFLIRYTMDYKSAGEAYQRAVGLDPHFGEAYYWWADMVDMPFDEVYFKAHKSEALDQLKRAEQMEPKLRPLIADDRAGIALSAMDYKDALPYLREYLRLWPTSPRAGVVSRLIKQLEAPKKP